jgi:hypothetical protein
MVETQTGYRVGSILNKVFQTELPYRLRSDTIITLNKIGHQGFVLSVVILDHVVHHAAAHHPA